MTDAWAPVPFEDAFHGKPRGLEIPQIDLGKVQPAGRWPVVGQGSAPYEGYTDDTSLLFPTEHLPVILYGPHTRRVRLVAEPFVAGPNVRFIWPTAGFDGQYAYYMALAAEVPSRGYNDHFTLFKQQTFLQPPLPEQRAIARALQSVEAAVAATEQVVAASRELRTSTAGHLFTFGPVSVIDAEHVTLVDGDELGRRPNHWTIQRIGDACQVVTGRTPSTADSSNFGGDVPFFTPGDLGGSLRLRSASRTLTRRGLAAGRSIPSRSTLLVCIGATIGKVGLTEIEPSATNQQINALIPGRGMDPEFLAYLMLQCAQRIIVNARSTTLPILSKGALAGIRVALAPEVEQRSIAAILRAMDQKIEAEDQHCLALKAAFSALLRDLTTGRIRLPSASVAPSVP